jgi:ATP-dependent exoDNAse (exonuclease V) beta subunit
VNATPLEIEAQAPPPRDTLDLSVEEARRRTAEAADRRARAGALSFVHTTVTTLAKEEASLAPAVAKGESTASMRALRGFSWGSAVHGALAVATSGAEAEALRSACRDLLVEHSRPLDDHGEPVELDELVELVRTVERSELWVRAQRAEAVRSEIPFAAPGVPAGRPPLPPTSGPRVRGAKPQLDLFGGSAAPVSGVERDDEDVATAAEGASRGGVDEPREDESRSAAPQILEGVIDLAFREHDGWVVVDYKTDVGTDPDFIHREAAYRRQVDLYAEAWSRLTGELVKERVLFFTAQGRIERW